MAKLNSILNYAEQYGSVSLYIGGYNPVKSNGLITSGDYAKIFFTGDGHIITHGVDYTPTFGDNLRDNPLEKGLVPASNYVPNQKFKFLSNEGTWKELTVAELPIATDFNDGQGNDGSNLIYTAKQVYDFFQSELSVLDVMKFLGEFNPDDLSNFPKGGKCEKGDTYRASGFTSNFAGAEIHAGDLLICIKDYEGNDVTAEDVNSSEYWMVVEANIDGITEHKVNGQKYEVFTSLASRPNFDIYAPVTGGTQDEILVSAGDAAPVWRNKNDLDLISISDKAKIVSKIEISNEGAFTVTALDNTTNLLTYTPSANTDDWNISIKGKSAGTKNKLTLGTGLHYADGKTSFDGSEDIQLKLSVATKELIGGVIIDNQNGTVAAEESTISVNQDGMIYLTAGNIANALGFTPGNTQNVYSYKGVITSTALGTTNVDGTNPFFNIIHKKEGEDTWSPASSSQFIGTNGIKIDGQSGNIIFDLQEATTNTYGGIKVFKKNATEITVEAPAVSKTNRYYGVELDSTGKAFVYVPWADENPAFNEITVNGGAKGTGGKITASTIDSQFTLSAGNGINLVLTDPNNITINQDIWKVVSSTEMGYAPAMAVGGELGASHYILSFIEGLPAAWNKLPPAALRDTWRAIKVGGVELANTDAIDATGAVIGSAIDFTALPISGSEKNKTKITFVKAANASETHKIDISSTWRPVFLGNQEIHKDYSIAFEDSADIVVEPKHIDATNETQYISFELSWYNISEDAREIVED